MLVAPRRLADRGAPRSVQTLPGAAVTPWAALPVHPGPLWGRRGEHAPCEAPVDDIKKRMDHRPPLELAVAPPRLGWWAHIFAPIPFGLREVWGGWIGVHPQRVLH
jgi:hypothetical protein